jgi:cystathionine beta-lyase
LSAPALFELEERSGIAGVTAAVAAFDEGESWLDDTVAYVAANHRLVQAALPQALPGARVTRPDATYLAWLDLRDTELAGEPAEVLLDRARVALVPGRNFGQQYGGWARMNLATSTAIVREAIDRIGAAVR